MASRFVLTAQVQLQAPTNTRQVVNQIQQQLKGVNVKVNLQGGQQASRQINNLNKATKQATTQADKMGKAFGASIRRFGAFTIATRAVSLFTNSLASATKEAIDFERELIKISQVTGKTMGQLKGLEKIITGLATNLGVSSRSILSTGRILAQAGIQAEDLKVALTALAKTELAPTFEDITKTAEGAVAILAQFGQGVGELERQLGAINAVAGQFAVESGDLISVIRRTGGVFKAAGGDLNELIALFTSVRATTRESAESIATGLRTIFTRIQRPKTIEFLKQFGVELTDLNGKFIGPFEAIKQLSAALSGLEQGDIQFVRIAEELGGFRQIGKVIPLLQQFETAERARQAALEGGDSLTKDSAKAQQALAVQISKVKEEFLALIRGFSQTSSFQMFVKTSLELASSLIKIADALKPLLPLLAAFGAIKFARGAAGFARGIGAGIKGGSPTGFAKGGVVPGTGNRDTVPAMLTPGEFVIKKSSVGKIGAGTLAQMNENKYNSGGFVIQPKNPEKFGALTISGASNSIAANGKAISGQSVGTLQDLIQNKLSNQAPQLSNKDLNMGASGFNTKGLAPINAGGFSNFLTKGGGRKFNKSASGKPKIDRDDLEDAKAEYADTLKTGNFTADKRELLQKQTIRVKGPFSAFPIGGGEKMTVGENLKGNPIYSSFQKEISSAAKTALIAAAQDVAGKSKLPALLDIPPAFDADGDPPNKVFNQTRFLDGAQESIEGFILEGVIGAITNASVGGGGTRFDFPSLDTNATARARLQKLFIDEKVNSLDRADAKRQASTAADSDGGIHQKVASSLAEEKQKFDFNIVKKPQGFNSGGGISGSDTVPAMLTPGEFVINKKAASKIGAANLDRMNKKGVQGFAKGGPVGGVQFLNPGGEVQRLQQIEARLVSSLESVTSQFEKANADSNALKSSKPEAQARVNAAGASPEDQANLQKVLKEEVKAREAYLATSSKKEEIELQLITIQEKLAKKLEGQAFGKEIAAEGKKQQASKKTPEPEEFKPSPQAVKVAENARERAAAKQGAGAGDILGSRPENRKDIEELKLKPASAKATVTRKNAALGNALESVVPAAKEAVTPKSKKSKLPSEMNPSLFASKDSKVSSKSGSSKGLSTEKTLQTLGKNFNNYAKASINWFKTLGTEKTLLTFGKNFNTAAKSGALRGSGGAAPAAKEAKQERVLFGDIDPSDVKFKDSGPSKKDSLKSDNAQKALASAEAKEKRQQKAIEQIDKRKKKAKTQREGGPRDAELANKKANLAQNMLLGATAMAAFIPKIEAATDGMGGLMNEMPGLIGGFTAMQGVAAGIDTESKSRTQGFKKAAKGALQTASFTMAANKAIDAYSGTHLKADQAVKAASEANDEASLAAAEKAAVESANAKNLNKVSAGVTGAFGAVAGVAEMIPGPWGKVLSIGLKVVGGLAGLAVKLGALEAIGISGDDITNFFAILGMGPSVNQTKAQTAATIQNARSQKILAEASKDAAEELKKIESGDLTATESLGAGGAAAKSAQAIAAQNDASINIIKANNQANTAMGRISGGLDRAAARGGLQGMTAGVMGAGYDLLTGGRRAANKQQSEAEKRSITERNAKALNDLQPRLTMATREQVTAASAGGRDVSFDQFKSKLDSSILAMAQQTDEMNGNTAEMDKLKKNFENVKKATIENIKFIKAMNFGLSDVTSGIQAYGASLSNLTASQQTGFSTAAVAATTLSTAITSAGKNISSNDLNASLDLLGDNLQRFGANAKQISGAKELITGLNNVQKGAADALAAVKDGFAGGSTDPKAIQGQLKEAILGSIPDSSPVKQKLIDSFGNLELSPESIEKFLNTGDVSGILDQAFGPISDQVQKQLIEPLKKMAEQEKVLVGLAVQRREAEQKLIAVQKQAIDTQIDAAKSLEFFGGPKFTPEKEFDARRRQANLTLQDSGIAGLATGSAADIRSASDSLMSQFSNQQAAQNAAAITGGGAFGGVAGIDKDRRAELKASNQALIDITKSGIEQRKQELDLIKKKNQAEKDALNSLLGGDVESFFDQAIGAAAGSALRTGDAAAASLFGAGALGTGLQGLQGTGLSDAENSRASQLAFGAFGLGEDAARTFSGTTTEEERIKAEGRELSQLQSELADQSVDLEEMTVSATTVVITAANLKMQDISDQVTRAQNIAGFNRGGVVYANKGMFIPRGTDTVPAMLTPGEFVVNRAAVQRGNNLQMLRSMNSNSAPTQATQNLSSGGPVRYRANGSTGPEGPGGIDLSKFEDMVNKFQEVTDKLGNVNIKHMFEKLGTLDINHMFNGNMQQAFKDEILSEAGNMMARSKFNNDGSITTSDRSVLG